MSGALERALGRVVEANSRRMASRASDRGAPNPRDLTGVTWADALASAQPEIRAEWDAFVDAGRLLPRMRDLIDEDQGEEGSWRAGLLVSRGRPAGPLPSAFPRTVDHLRQVPGLWSALFSVMEPGTELPEHVGFNSGMLRFHLGVVAEGDTALAVEGRITPYREGHAILFDDTVAHAAWTRGPAARVTLFCELLRPAPRAVALANRGVQALIALDPRYRRAPARAAAWHDAVGS